MSRVNKDNFDEKEMVKMAEKILEAEKNFKAQQQVEKEAEELARVHKEAEEADKIKIEELKQERKKAKEQLKSVN